MQTDVDWMRLKRQWEQLLQDSHYGGNLERASEEIGRSPSYLRGFFRNRSVPKADLIVELSRVLMVSPSDLLEYRATSIDTELLGKAIAKQVSNAMMDAMQREPVRPSSVDVLKWWSENEGRLDHCGSFIEFADLYPDPRMHEGALVPERMGKKSLATKELGAPSTELFEQTIAPLGKSLSEYVIQAHISSLERGAFATVEKLSAKHPTTGLMIDIKYLRTLAPVTTDNGSTLVLNYSELISAN